MCNLRYSWYENNIGLHEYSYQLKETNVSVNLFVPLLGLYTKKNKFYNVISIWKSLQPIKNNERAEHKFHRHAVPFARVVLDL